MNLIETIQEWVAQVPELVQPLIVALAGAIPFIEGEGAATIGIVGGINPVIAAIAAIIGNFLCVTAVVLLTARARSAVTSRTRARAEASTVPATAVGGDPNFPSAPQAPANAPAAGETGRTSARQQKFQRAFERYGVPGVSLLGPLLLPTQFTASMLAAAGIAKARILLWQGVAIVAWTTVFTVIISQALAAVG